MKLRTLRLAQCDSRQSAYFLKHFFTPATDSANVSTIDGGSIKKSPQEIQEVT